MSRESGIAGSPGKSFGAVATDVNNDGLMDLFVANDTMPNFLFLNKGSGKFEEIGLSAGVAYGEAGRPRSGMGVDAADYDGDGWQDLFVANIDQEFFSLYHNEKELIFTDQPGEIAPATQLLSGWGLKFFDYDNDGDPDLFLVNGHPDDMIESRVPRVKHKEPLLMFENTGRAFKDVSAKSGAVFSKMFSGRGMALGDFDNDGDADVLTSNNGEPPLLLRNQGGNRNNWIGLQLVATKSNPAAVGAVITWQAGTLKRTRLKDERRQLSFVTRSARDSRCRQCDKNRFSRNTLAQRQGRQTHKSAAEHVRKSCRRLRHGQEVTFALKAICVICVICGLVFFCRAQQDTFFSEWRPNADTRGIRFVGNKACIDCHPREAAQLTTPMAQALEVAPDCKILTARGRLTFKNGNYSYEISRQGKNLTYTVSDGKNTLSTPILVLLWSGPHRTDLSFPSQRHALRNSRQLL